jgi:hypothetical protein
MNCDKCKFKKSYTTGADEYPPLTNLEYCGKGHWENGYEPYLDDSNKDPFLNCKDSKQQ